MKKLIILIKSKDGLWWEGVAINSLIVVWVFAVTIGLGKLFASMLYFGLN